MLQLEKEIREYRDKTRTLTQVLMKNEYVKQKSYLQMRYRIYGFHTPVKKMVDSYEKKIKKRIYENRQRWKYYTQTFLDNTYNTFFIQNAKGRKKGAVIILLEKKHQTIW
ncbi:hypothetical protein AB205_0114460 [Aquarana catesbeiana]|uniref:Uncharacterized protein n=1 Tax=Aquarana catesbeiana TaxID=8400 RepID=A0A2G9SA38_AQUCT|nr:hypothetical protein AB205_0114460 [Aquarana catesbeiana]